MSEDKVRQVRLVFTHQSDLSEYSGRKIFYFFEESLHSDRQPNLGQPAANFTYSRSINKNIITTKLPVDSFYGGGLAVDIGMSEDVFELQYTTYSYDDYRYICGLVKCNNDLKIGDLQFSVDTAFSSQRVVDTFSVGLKNAQFNMRPGAGFCCDIKLSLIVVDPTLSENATGDLI